MTTIKTNNKENFNPFKKIRSAVRAARRSSRPRCPPDRYNSGYSKGKNAGYNSGKNAGYTSGRRSGYTSGKNSRNPEVNRLRRQRVNAINSRDRFLKFARKQYSRANHLKTAVNRLGSVSRITVAKRSKNLYDEFFNEKEKSLLYNSDLVLNQQDLLSKQREIKSIKKNRAQTVNTEYQDLLSGLTMNERVMDYDLYDSGTNKKINRLLYIITLILIVATVALIFLRKFSML